MAKKNEQFNNQNKAQNYSKNKKNNRKSGSGYRGKDYKSKNNFRDNEVISTTNDVSLYTHNPQLVKDAANIWFSAPLGTDITQKFNGADEEFTSKITTEKYFPGLMSFDVALTLGCSVDGTSPINTATADIYSYIRHENSGHANYDAADLMLYIAAMDTLHALHAFGRRSYGIARNYTYANRYYPKSLLESGRWDVEDLQRNLNQLRFGLNIFAAKMSTLRVPANLPIFKRHEWMFSGLYQDSNSLKAQTYLFNPKYVYQFALDSNGAGMLATVDADVAIGIFGDPGAMTVDCFLKMLNHLADVLINSEDMKIMSGDILKAYPNETLSFTTIGEDYQVLPVFDPVVCSQIQNMTIAGSPKIGSLNVTQDATVTGGYTGIRCTPTLKHSSPEVAAVHTLNKVLVCDIDSVTPEFIMEMTRLSVGLSSDESADYTRVESCGSELIVAAHVCLDPNLPFTDGSYSYDGSVLQDPSVNEIAAISKFNYHPAFYMMEPGYLNPEGFDVAILQDVTNFATIENSTLSNLHNVALLSLFNVPQNK